MVVLITLGVFVPDPFVAQIDSALQYFAQNICSLNLFVDVAVVLNVLKIFLDVFSAAVLFILGFYFVKVTGGIQK